MQIVTVSNFFAVKSEASRIINSLVNVSTVNLNKVLRECFVGKEVDSLSCTKINSRLISVKITLKSAVTVFQVTINRRGR